MDRYNKEEYPQILSQLKRDKEDFETFSTSYSRKIKCGDSSFFFADGYTRPEVMHLIRKVREDADKFIINDRDLRGEFKSFNKDLD